MGLRHRSIRLRVGLLIALPVLCLLALYGFVAGITLGSAVTQQHARSLKNDLADPVAAFQTQLATERHFALLSLANPTNTQVASALGLQESKTQQSLAALNSALTAPAVTSYASASEKAAITTLRGLASMGNLSAIRGRVADDAISIRAALAEYDSVINAGYQVIDEALGQQANVDLVTQATAVINLDRAASAAGEEWDLVTADIAQAKFPDADRLVFSALANQRQTLVANTIPQLHAPYSRLMASHVTPGVTAAMNAAEGAVINTPWRRGPAPAAVTGANATFIGYETTLGKSLAASGTALQNQASHDADVVILELILAAGLGLLGTIASIALSLVIGRGLIRQLRELRQSALALAHEKLPKVITQLRAGEQVDLAEYAPDETPSANEIEQVQQAFAVVQETAVQSAVDEARLRRGISDVFRNLAGRSQSLLHRQLTLLDGMERRATEPDELENLFRIDHLTTRMRRHAEGLIILSGEAPARGWRQPVPLVDVLRAAVAEVEDYTRIRVLCRTGAAVAGHAVADVIHLIAELAENATVFSPPNTPVRIQGDVVGRGFAIEIEDRGLGISAARLEEINANLANPPQFDLSGSDRLGLFIAGQLAQRHEIKITLRPSVYGGTTAIVLIPTALVVDEDSFERDPELAAAADSAVLAEGLAGRHALAQAVSQGASAGRNGLGSSHGSNGFGSNMLESGGAGAAGGPSASGGYTGGGFAGDGFTSSGFTGGGITGADAAGADAAGADAAGADAAGAETRRVSGSNGLAGPASGGFDFSRPPAGPAFGEDAGLPGPGTTGTTGTTGGSRTPDTGTGWDHLRVDPPARHAPGGPGNAGSGSGGSGGGSTGSSDTGSAGPRSTADFTGPVVSGDGLEGNVLGRPEPEPGADYVSRGFSLGGRQSPRPGLTGPAGPGSAGPNVRPASRDAASPGSGRRDGASLDAGSQQARRPAGEDSPSGPKPAAPGAGSDARISSSELARSGLPIRVRQASLAPQLRDSKPAQPAAGSQGFGTGPFAAPGEQRTAGSGGEQRGPSPTGAVPASPEAARNTMSALQRGWQLGRSEAADDAEPQAAGSLPRRSPSGQPFGSHDADPGSTDPEPADSADDERGGK